ncbi:MAG: beta strand repeat-containing protein, partial [Gammaproteobacteria bacterium]
NGSGVLGGGAVNVTASSGNISFADVSSGATGGTTLTASGITLQGFTTTLGALTIQNAGTFLVSGPVNLSGGLNQTGAGPVVLDSSINSSSGNVQIASSVTVSSGATASIATSGGDIIFNQNIVGSGSTSSLVLNSGAGNINLQAASNLGILNLQTSGTLSLGGNLSANNLLAAGVTGNILVAGVNVNITTVNSSVDFSHAIGINGLTAGSQSLAVNSGSGNVILPAVGQTTSLKSLTVNGGTITLANVTTSGSQSYTGNTQLGGDLTSLSNGGVAVNGDLVLLSDASISAAGGGNISINGDVNGAHALALTTPSGGVVLGGDVGASTALTSLTVNSATTSLGSVTTSGTQSYQSGSTRLAGVLNSKSGAIDFGGTLDIASASVIQANSIGFNGGASSVHGNTTLTLLPETNGLAVNIGGSGGGLTLNNTAMDGYNGGLYIGTGPGPGAPLYITSPVAVLAGNVTVNGSLTLGSSGSLLLAGMGNLYLNSGTLTANAVTLIAGSQGSVIQNLGASQTLIKANTVILVSGGQIGNLGQELNIQTSGSAPQVQIATGAIQTFLLPPNLPVVIGPAATIADAIAAQLGLFIQANSQVTSIGQQIAALVQTGGLLGGFIDVSL